MISKRSIRIAVLGLVACTLLVGVGSLLAPNAVAPRAIAGTPTASVQAMPTQGNVDVAVILLSTAKDLTQGYVDKGQPVPTGNAFAANVLIDAAIEQLGGSYE